MTRHFCVFLVYGNINIMSLICETISKFELTPLRRILLEKSRASQDIQGLLWNTKVYYHVYKSP